MFQFFANIFGYLLNFINNIIGNYGLAIILFTILVKLLILPLSIKQQKSMKKNGEMQEKIKVLQFKYKNDQQKLNEEMINLYKKENMSPFSGCLSAFIQFILLISIFYMVRNPLTYMVKIDKNKINEYAQQLKDSEISISQAYPEIDIIRELDLLKEKFPEDESLEKINMNMNFLGIDLRNIPQQNLGNWTVYIIPVLYIISTFISMQLTTKMQNNLKNINKNSEVIDITESKDEKSLIEKDKDEMEDTMAQTNKMMTWMMPVMSISISLVAPLGLALYWLVNNILMIIERLVLDKCIKD